MRIRALVAIALVTLPSGLSSQVARPPRGGRGGAAQPAPLPPEIAPVTRALAYKRSRWSAEGYSVVSSVSVPEVIGSPTRYTTLGAGTHAAYRYTDQWSATMDMTSSIPGGPTTIATVEVGGRYSPLSWEQQFRPFFDVRAGYTRLNDLFAMPATTSSGANQQLIEGMRYSRGVGALSGAGLEYSLTRTLAVTGELTAARNRMTSYHWSGPADVSSGSTYWMTSYRFVLGLRFNPVSTLHLAQPR